MTDLVRALLQEKQRIDQLIQEKTASLAAAPQGKVRVSRSHHTMQYYYRKDARSPEVFLPQKDRPLARQIVQRDYDRKLLQQLTQEQHHVNELLRLLTSGEEDSIALRFPEAKRALIKPGRPPREERIAAWLGTPHEGKPFAEDAPEIYTDRGERVRSKSEKIIADKLHSMGIPYKYEVPVRLEGFGTVYADFCLLDADNQKEYYWEHFGMMDDEAYCNKALRKIDDYSKNGILPGDRLIVTCETASKPVDTRVIERIIRGLRLQ